MTKKIIKRSGIALVPANDYFFIEFFVPLLEKTPDIKIFTIIWDKSSLDSIDPKIKRYVLELPSVVRIIEVEQLNGDIRKSVSITKVLLEQLSDVKLVLAMDLCSSVMLLAATAFENRGTKIALAQCSGLHQNIWISEYEHYRRQTSKQTMHTKFGLKISKAFNISRYPKYFQFLLSRFSQKFHKILLHYLIAPLAIGQILPKAPISKVRYFSSNKNYAVMIYEPDAKIFSKFMDPKNIIIAKPPYFSQGNEDKEKGLLIAFPGPISREQVEKKFSLFFSVLKKVVEVRKPQQVFYRFHPRESVESKRTLCLLLKMHFSEEIFSDISGQPLHDILSQCHTVVGGVSNLLAVARATSKTRLVVGVKNAGLDGILGTNIQYQDIGEIFWVSSDNELDSRELKRNSFFQKKEGDVSYYDVLLHLINDSSNKDLRQI